MKKFMVLILSLLLLLTACGGGGNKPAADAGGSDGQIVLQASHSLSATHPYHLGLEKYAEEVAKKTDGKVKIDIFHSGQLGNERDNIEGLQLGTLDIAVSSTGPVGTFEPTFQILDLPYLFTTGEEADKVLDGEIGDEILAKLDAIGVKGAAFWENGFRNLTNSVRPVNSVADMKGLKIRTMQNEVQMEAYKALGTDPTPMAYSEVFTSLQQKVLDGQENPLPVIYNDKLYEVQENLALTKVIYSPAMLLISNKTFEKVDEETAKILVETAKEVAAYQKGLIREQEAEQLKLLEEAGMKITEPDLTEFKAAVQPVYDKYANQFDKVLLDRILEATK